jgi:NAD(P)-dependent dehydrogenase (short-subunit alcohol dehydrogenase family)
LRYLFIYGINLAQAFTKDQGEKMLLKEKVAVVTGAGRGIGRAIAIRLARAGACVVVNDIDEAAATEAVREIHQEGGQAATDTNPVGTFQSGEAIIQTALTRFGPVDILVNNAGILRDAMVHKMSEADWDLVIQVHLKGTFATTRAAYDVMRERRRGKIINVTSYSGLRGNIGQANYCAAKAGIIGLTKSNAKEFARYNIQVNAISPNAATRMVEAIPEAVRAKIIEAIPAGRFGKPEEITGLVCFLGSADSDYITGQVIPVDGGISI